MNKTKQFLAFKTNIDALVLKLLSILVILVIVLDIFQIKNQCHTLQKQQSLLEGKTVLERNNILFGELHTFPLQVKQIFPGRHKCDLISDDDFSQDPAMIERNTLAYHFYPNISLRYDNGTPNDCILYFLKNNAEAALPREYRVLLKTTDGKILLAVKKANQNGQ